MPDIIEIRKKIDSIDDAILDLLKERFALVKMIGEWKRNEKKEINDRDREEEILFRLQERTDKNGMTGDFIKSIWNQIFQQSRAIQGEKHE